MIFLTCLPSVMGKNDVILWLIHFGYVENTWNISKIFLKPVLTILKPIKRHL